jgi:hypothetical protein
MLRRSMTMRLPGRLSFVVVSISASGPSGAIVGSSALVNGGGNVDTYNIYMDELPTGEEFDGEEMVEVEFRVVPATNDDGDAENNAVIAGLDLVDLINLRDALQQEIDDYALAALESEAMSLAESE